MVTKIKVIEIELSHPLEDLTGLNSYASLYALVRWQGFPVGYVDIPLLDGNCSASALSAAIRRGLSDNLLQIMLRQRMDEPIALNPKLITNDNLPDPAIACIENTPLVTVAVCTRDRTKQLENCLRALCKLSYSKIEIFVVDNAPSNDETKNLVEKSFPDICYFSEPRPGLDWARNRVIEEAHGEIIAYTDDDVMVDPLWVDALVKAFQYDPGVMAVTGLVAPFELEAQAQILFERYGGFGRGFKRQWYHFDKNSQKTRAFHIGAGRFGTGANMAYRAQVFEQIGTFDPALDVGTVTNGGGDLEMFFRILEEGYTLVYEPAALIWHQHRKTFAQLRVQLSNNGIGLYSYFVRSAQAYPQRRWQIFRFAFWWFWYWDIKRLLKSFISTPTIPRELIVAELRGALIGLSRYTKAKSQAEDIKRHYAREPQARFSQPQFLASELTADPVENLLQEDISIAIRTVDISRPLVTINDLSDYASCQIFVFKAQHLLGKVDIRNSRQSISPAQIRDALIEQLCRELADLFIAEDLTHPGKYLTHKFIPSLSLSASNQLPVSISVSIVLATYDRPEQLRQSLRALSAQDTPRSFEIVVVDNHPVSGLTPPIVALFPEIVLISETRQGLAYARNAGFLSCSGDIVVATDDDVIMPPNWIETLIVPFARSDVGAVTGNVLPYQLETKSQQLFEEYGGLGRGFHGLEVNSKWLKAWRRRAAPTWELGATANAAFRAEVFRHPQIGLMDEALGPGMPSGVGEDTYLYYKIIKAGYTLIYEPTAYVWHAHRSDQAALRRQIYNYSKGHVAYHLTTLLRDGDRRALFRLFIELPRAYLKRIYQRLRGRSNYPVSLILLEIRGNLVGPFALWRSRQRVRREGRSEFPV